MTDTVIAHPTQFRPRQKKRLLSPISRLLTVILGTFEALPVRRNWPAYLLAALAAAIYVVVTLSGQGINFLRGQMWAEMGSNYYLNAASGSLSDKLFATDAGYFALPQRLIALFADLAQLPSSWIPYFYTGAGTVVAALLLAVFVLPVFRPVIANDTLRFAMVVACALVIDPETRLFINFSYIAVIPIVAVTALALLGREKIPAWAWGLTVFIVSKPAVLCVLPAMVIVSFLGNRRFRLLAWTCSALGLVQVGRLALSASAGGTLMEPNTLSLTDKIVATGQSFVAYLTRFALSPVEPLLRWELMRFGLLFVAILVAVVLFSRSRSGALIATAVSAGVFALAINCFSMTSVFNRELTLILPAAAYDRRSVVMMVATIFLVGCCVAAVTESAWWGRRPLPSPNLRRIVLPTVASILFVAWFAGSGWAGYAKNRNDPMGIPVGQVSTWQAQSVALDRSAEPVCVVLDPWGWWYGRDCVQVSVQSLPTFEWRPVADRAVSGAAALTVPVPAPLPNKDFLNFAVLVKPSSSDQKRDSSATLVLGFRAAPDLRIRESVQVPDVGGTVQFAIPAGHRMNELTSVTVLFTAPTDVGWSPQPAGSALGSGPAVQWFSTLH